jgi:BirA family biotin operon repressor/biotin-[acetyl-CoA-carboxylase] ligase
LSSVTPGLLDVLRQLSAAEFVSGEALAEQLGLSRATIHNRLRGVEALGLRVHSVPGRGHRLARPVSWLDAGRLAPSLAKLGFELSFFDSVDSTNTRLLDLAALGQAHRTVLLAEWQETGRGRRGRQWLAPLGGGLTFSLLWRFNRPLAELSGLSLAVGLGLARAAVALGARGVAVKWPNDVLHQGAKLAGILVEVQGDALGPGTAVIGVGLNVHLPEPERQFIDQPVTDLTSILGDAPERNTLLCGVLAELGAVLEHFDQDGFAALRADWEALHAYQGREVSLSGGREPVHGRVLGVDPDGALLLDTATGPRRVLSGEMSLRRA